MRAELTQTDAGSLLDKGNERSGGLANLPPRSSFPLLARLEPEVRAERPTRRTFTSEYKKRILEGVDACTEQGQIGQLLRREGLYSSHIALWRRQRCACSADGFAPKKRGRKPISAEALAIKVAQLEREKQMLQDELRKARIIIDLQKNSQLLDIPTNKLLKDEDNS